MSVSGTITKLEGARSATPASALVSGTTGPSGQRHWVLVTRFEGDAKDPKAFLVNDPDLGGELRCTPSRSPAWARATGT